jgi:hypothetical protein
MTKKRHSAKYLIEPATAAKMFKSLNFSQEQMKAAGEAIMSVGKVEAILKEFEDDGLFAKYPKEWLGFRYIPTGEIYEAVGFHDYHMLTISLTGLFKGASWECYDAETFEPLTSSARAFAKIVMSGAQGSWKVK